MLSFFKRNKKENMKKQGEDTVISSKELLDVEGSEDEQEVSTELSIHPSMNVMNEQLYVLRFLNNELPPLKSNQVSLAGIDHRVENGKLIVSAFIRNSIAKGITFKQTPILLIGPNGEHIARREFDLSAAGVIPPKSSRPWNFEYRSTDLLQNEIPSKGWKLAFQLTPAHRLDLDESWEEALPASQKEKLVEVVNNLETPKKGEVNFLGLQARPTQEGGLSVTILLRNGSDKTVQFQQLPLEVEDATNQVIASGTFKLDKFEVKAHTTKPWTFVFPKEFVHKENADLTNWKVKVVQ
jgi:accessory Sec system S-layer assembly protein